MPTAHDRRDTLVLIALALGVMVAVWAPQLRTLYPFTYDELVYLRKTRAYDQWLREGVIRWRAGERTWLFSSEAIASAEALKDMHPSFVKLAGLVPHWALQATLGREGGARLTGALFLALACGTVYWFLTPRCGRIWALTGALGLALHPRIFGHAHFFALDVPIMALALLAALAGYRAGHTNRWGPALSAALLVGLALGTKLNAIALIPHLGLWLLGRRPPGVRKLGLCLPLAFPVFMLCWPWLWPDPAGRLGEYLAFHAHHYHPGVTYLGTIYGGNTTAPWHYPLVMLALTLPTTWVLALVPAVIQTLRGRLGEAGTFLLLGLVCHLALACWPTAARYGGIRLFLPAIPYALMLAMLVVHRWYQRLRADQWPHTRLLQVLIVIGLLLPGTVGIMRLYPYCLSYYSGLTGGLWGAKRLGLELTYWGDAYAGAQEFMAAPEQKQAQFVVVSELATGVLDALVAVGKIPPQHRLLGRFLGTDLPPEADYIIADNHPPIWPPAFQAVPDTTLPVYEIQREGVALLRIYANPARRH